MKQPRAKNSVSDPVRSVAGGAGLRSAQWALRERVKELTCLYGIAQVAERREIPLEQVLQRIVELLPPGWQYPEISSARITLDDRAYETAKFHDGPFRQSAEIIVGGIRRGQIDVVYAAATPVFDEGPFLKEERSLINEVGRQIALIVERRQAEHEKAKLEEQLRQTDRLATIGRLAAGTAHELNEPLGGILGFAQLAQKCPALPDEAAHDLQKIIRAALHAREVVKELMLFARQTPPRKTRVNLNQVVDEALELLQPRLATEGVELCRQLAVDLPDVVADPAQLHQVVINLAVNGLQAMPSGGKLTVSTWHDPATAHLVVEDTGEGMNDKVLKHVFLPFFTTKEVGEGTGLGLSVVHGIVSAHGGTIHVESTPGQGTRFEVELPLGTTDDKEAQDA